MNCNTTHYRANSSSVPGDPTLVVVFSRHIQVGPLLLAAVIGVGGLLITFLRWHLLVRAVGIPFSRYNAIRLGLAGYYFNTFLPGSIGGDIVKGYAIARDQDRRTRAVATVLIDRIIGLWALFWFVSIIGTVFWLLDDPILQNPRLMAIISFSIVFMIVSFAVWMAVGFLSEERANRLADWLKSVRKIGGSLAELWRACWMYRKQSRAVLIAMLMSLVGHMGWVLIFDLSVHAFETPNPELDVGTLPEHMVIVPVGMTVSAVIPVPGGIGVGEAAYGELYKMLGKEKENGIAGCMSQRVIFWCMGLLGYIVYTRMPVRSNLSVGSGPDDSGPEEKRAASPEPAPPETGGVVLRAVATDP